MDLRVRYGEYEERWTMMTLGRPGCPTRRLPATLITLERIAQDDEGNPETEGSGTGVSEPIYHAPAGLASSPISKSWIQS